MSISARMLDFQDHRRDLGANRYVYAVVSRRARGLSIGINLHPCGTCNIACAYCQVDRSLSRPPPGRLEALRLETELSSLLLELNKGHLWAQAPFHTVDPSLRVLADIAFAGDGEPTSHLDFPQALVSVIQERDRAGLQGCPIRVLTNATLLHLPHVRPALDLLYRAGGEVWAKLDAGTESAFQRIHRTDLPLSRVLENISRLAQEHPVVIQSLFSKVDGRAPDPAEIAAWLDRLGVLLSQGARILDVQVTTVARRPADLSYTALSAQELEMIAKGVTRLGLRASVHPASTPLKETIR